MQVPNEARALDLGCAVGRSAFALSSFCHQVIGVDYSRVFIEAAQQMGERQQIAYDRVDEGALTTALVAKLPVEAVPERVSFEQGDALNLRPDLGSFDVVLIANLICRLANPLQCLEQMPALVKPGGQLVITSPYTWLDEFTPPDRWLGGFARNDGEEPVVSSTALQEFLTPHFCLEETAAVAVFDP